MRHLLVRAQLRSSRASNSALGQQAKYLLLVKCKETSTINVKTVVPSYEIWCCCSGGPIQGHLNNQTPDAAWVDRAAGPSPPPPLPPSLPLPFLS